MSDPLNDLRQLGERNKRAVEGAREQLANLLRPQLSAEDLARALALFDQAIGTLRGTPAQRQALLGTLQAIGTQAAPGVFRPANRPSIRPRSTSK